MDARRFVRAMLRPHHREDAELNQGRLPAKQLLNAGELCCCQIVSGDYFGGDRFHRIVGSRQKAVGREETKVFTVFCLLPPAYCLPGLLPTSFSIAARNSGVVTRPKCLNATLPWASYRKVAGNAPPQSLSTQLIVGSGSETFSR